MPSPSLPSPRLAENGEFRIKAGATDALLAEVTGFRQAGRSEGRAEDDHRRRGGSFAFCITQWMPLLPSTVWVTRRSATIEHSE